MALGRAVPMEGFAGSQQHVCCCIFQPASWWLLHLPFSNCIYLSFKKVVHSLQCSETVWFTFTVFWVVFCPATKAGIVVAVYSCEVWERCCSRLASWREAEGSSSPPHRTSAARGLLPRQEYISGYPTPDKNWIFLLFITTRGPFLSHSFIVSGDGEIPICVCVLPGLDERAVVFRGRRLRQSGCCFLWVPMPEFSSAQGSVLCGRDTVYEGAKSRFPSRLQIKQTVF